MPIVLSKPTIDIGLVAQNIPAMLEFYGDTLGLPRLDDIRMSEFTIVRFQAGDVVLKILEYDTAPSSHAATGDIGSGTGIRYMTVSVGNLSETLAAVRSSQSSSITEEAVEVRPGAWIAFVTDPDGNTIEFVQRGGTL